MRKDSPFATAVILVLGAALSRHAHQPVQAVKVPTADSSGYETPWIARIENEDGRTVISGALVSSKHVLVFGWVERNDGGGTEYTIQGGKLRAIIGSKTIDIEVGKRYQYQGYFILTLKSEVDIVPACISVASDGRLKPGSDVIVTGWNNAKELEEYVKKVNVDYGVRLYVTSTEWMNFDVAMALEKRYDQYVIAGFYRLYEQGSYVFSGVSPDTKSWMDSIIYNGSPTKGMDHCSVCLDQTPWVVRIKGKDGDMVRFGDNKIVEFPLPLTGVLVSSQHVLVFTQGAEKIHGKMTADNLQVVLCTRTVNVDAIQWVDDLVQRRGNIFAVLTLKSNLTIPTANVLTKNTMWVRRDEPITVLAWTNENLLKGLPAKYLTIEGRDSFRVSTSGGHVKIGLALVKRDGKFVVAGFGAYRTTGRFRIVIVYHTMQEKIKRILAQGKSD